MSSAAANAGGNGAPAPGANLSNREITRRYFAYSAMFWTGPTRWIAWGYTLALLAVALSLVVAMVEINRWMAIFFDAVERKDAAAIISRLKHHRRARRRFGSAVRNVDVPRRTHESVVARTPDDRADGRNGCIRTIAATMSAR